LAEFDPAIEREEAVFIIVFTQAQRQLDGNILKSI